MASCIAPIQLKVKGEFITVPCGKCNLCLQAKRQDWSFRLYQELRTAQSASFLTLTYEDEFVPINVKSKKLSLVKKDLHNFHKALRQCQTRTLLKIKKREKMNSDRYKHLKHKWKIRYYSVGEYGSSDTQRPHYHSIMFNMHPLTLQKLGDKQVWTRGHIQNGSVGFESIAYCTKYVIDREGEYEGREKPFTLMSRKPGLGENYMNSKKYWHKQQGDHLDDYRYYVMYQGQKQRMPRYYKDKIFTPLERKVYGIGAIEESFKMYLEKIDKLAMVHPDPMRYYEELLQHKHDSIKIKSLQLNTL